MKQLITVEIIPLDTLRPSDYRRYPTVQEAIQKMPAAEHTSKSILIVDAFPARLIDNKAISRYFPMYVGRTFAEAVALLQDCDNLFMARGGLNVTWSKADYRFKDNNGNDWTAGPDVILSNDKVWYVYSKNQSHQAEAEFASL